eukprot:scaffold55077_cov66-Phaeocystis_antarctica.AAC.2
MANAWHAGNMRNRCGVSRARARPRRAASGRRSSRGGPSALRRRPVGRSRGEAWGAAWPAAWGAAWGAERRPAGRGLGVGCEAQGAGRELTHAGCRMQGAECRQTPVSRLGAVVRVRWCGPARGSCDPPVRPSQTRRWCRAGAARCA